METATVAGAPAEERLDDAVTAVDTDLRTRHEAGSVTCQEDHSALHTHQHERPQQAQGANSQTSLLGLPSKQRTISTRASRLWKRATHATHGCQALPRFLHRLSVAKQRTRFCPPTYLELRVVRENGLRELGEHVAGAEYTRVRKQDDRRVTSSNLRQLTRTPFFAHSTAREAAMCFTATRIERTQLSLLPCNQSPYPTHRPLPRCMASGAGECSRSEVRVRTPRAHGNASELTFADMEATRTMLPPPWGIIWRAASRAVKNAPWTLISYKRFIRSKG